MGNGPPFQPRRPKRTKKAGHDARNAAEPAGVLVEAILAKFGVAGAVREHRLVTGWNEIVGERIAARAWPTSLTKGVLHVRVANSAWMQELSFLREAITRAANERCGNPPLVKEVRLHLPGKGEPQAEKDDVVAALAQRVRRKKAPPTRAKPTPLELSRIDAETAKVADGELREAIRGLRRKLGL